MAFPLLQPVQPRRGKVADNPRKLTVVPARRRVAWFAVTLTVLVSAVMMAAVGLHTRIAERQLEIDELERGVRSAQEEFDVLRSQRAELRSPTRISAAALELGMVVGSESEFVAVDPMTLAITIARTGQVPVDDQILVGADQQLEPLDQFRLVKEVSAEAP
jgi:cell division protein FtsL